MTTPNIGSGVVERVKPVRLRSQAVFRFEAALGAGASITTPIFDCVSDGWPYTQVEVGGAALIRVASPQFHVYVMITSTVGMRLDIFELHDSGAQLNPVTIYVPSDGGNSYKPVKWQCPGRRCQFRLLNTPLGTLPGTTSTAVLEVVNEG